MIDWLKRQLRKFTAFFIALYLTIITVKDVKGERVMIKCWFCGKNCGRTIYCSRCGKRLKEKENNE